MVAHLSLESGLQQPFRQLLKQPALACQLQAFSLRPGHELVQEPVIKNLRRDHRFGRLDHVLVGNRCNPP